MHRGEEKKGQNAAIAIQSMVEGSESKRRREEERGVDTGANQLVVKRKRENKADYH